MRISTLIKWLNAGLLSVLIGCVPSYAVDNNLNGCNGADIGQSIAACTTLLNSKPPADIRSKALFNRGVRYQSTSEDSKALADFSEAIDADPTDALAFAARGSLLIRKEDFLSARNDLNAAIRLNPSLAAARTARGLLNLYTGKLADCVEDSTEALRLDPRQQAAYNNRGAAY